MTATRLPQLGSVENSFQSSRHFAAPRNHENGGSSYDDGSTHSRTNADFGRNRVGLLFAGKGTRSYLHHPSLNGKGSLCEGEFVRPSCGADKLGHSGRCSNPARHTEVAFTPSGSIYAIC